MATHQKIAMVILAAGASTRMKPIKQLLPWKNTTLLGHSIEQGLSTKVDSVFVVLGANKEKIIPTIKDYTIQIIENIEWQLGLGKSIACAVKFLVNSPTQFDGILIALADQPMLIASHYDKLISKFSVRICGIAATKQNAIVGVPAIFSEKYFKQLVVLNEDKGAKSVINTYSDDVCIVDANGTAVDVDTMDVYSEFYEKYGR